MGEEVNRVGGGVDWETVLGGGGVLECGAPDPWGRRPGPMHGLGCEPGQVRKEAALNKSVRCRRAPGRLSRGSGFFCLVGGGGLKWVVGRGDDEGR